MSNGKPLTKQRSAASTANSATLRPCKKPKVNNVDMMIVAINANERARLRRERDQFEPNLNALDRESWEYYKTVMALMCRLPITK